MRRRSTGKRHREYDILSYEGNTMEPAERSELEQHLLHCAECRETRVEMRAFLQQLDLVMCLMVSKVPIQDLEMETQRLRMQAKLRKGLN